MRRLAILVALAGCTDALPAHPDLARDRIVAVRAEPPHIASGGVSILEALVAHATGPVTTEVPMLATAAGAPGDLFTAVHYQLDHWEVVAPDGAALDAARSALHLAPTAPVPLEVTLIYPGQLLAQKVVYLGDTAANPVPALTIDGTAPASDDVTLLTRTVQLATPAATAAWFSSCGTLHAADQATAQLDVARDGQLVLVVRDDAGGVAWRVLAIHVP